MTELNTLNEIKLNTLNTSPKKSLFDNYSNINLQNNNTSKYTRSTINQSWDFTPFPKFLFPNEKKHFLKNLNK